MADPPRNQNQTFRSRRRDKSKKEVKHQNAVCSYNVCNWASDEDLPKKGMTTSKTKTRDKQMITTLLNMGTSTCLLFHAISKELHISITPAPHICLKAVRGERMEIKEVAMCYLDIYEGAHMRNRTSSMKVMLTGWE